MNKNEQIIVRKVSFWNKIKQIFKNTFLSSKDISENKEDSEVCIGKTKKEIMEIYNNVKNNDMDLNELDSNTLYKIMLLIKEEIEISNKKLKEEFDQTTLHLCNLKMYNKQVEFLKKNSQENPRNLFGLKENH